MSPRPKDRYDGRPWLLVVAFVCIVSFFMLLTFVLSLKSTGSLNSSTVVGLLGLASVLSGGSYYAALKLKTDLDLANERLNDFSRGNSDWFWEMDQNLHIVWLSKVSEEFFGLTREEMYGTRRGDFRHPLDSEITWAKHMDDIEQRRPFKNFVFALEAKGGMRWVKLSGVPHFSSSGEFLGYRGSAGDITELINTRVELNEKQSLLANTVENLTETFSLWDADDRLIVCNRAFRKLHQTIPEQLEPGTTFDDFISATIKAGLFVPQETASPAHDETCSSNRRGAPMETPLEVHSADGRILRVRNQRTPDGGIASFGLDVTKERQQEKELRESEERLALAVRSVAIWDWNVETDDLYISDSFAQSLGYRSQDIPDVDSGFLANFIHPEDRDDWSNSVRDHLNDPDTVYRGKYRFLAKDGEIRWFMFRGQSTCDAYGRVARSTGVLTDITDQVALEDQLRHAQKMEAVGNLTSGIAHDFNNLLSVVLGSLELIHADSTDTSNKELAGAGIRAAQRGADLTKGMLSFVRKTSLKKTRTDMNELVRETQSWAARILPDRIDLKVKLAKDCDQVEVDRSLAQNAILNLILNARDAMPSGGQITVTTRQRILSDDEVHTLPSGPYLEVAIQDNGSGIPPDMIDKIFDPFFTSKPKGLGTGLGLSMVKNLMTRLEGAITIASEPDAGTTVSLFFPYPEENHAAEVVDDAKSVPVTTNGAQILLVDDDKEVLSLLDLALTRAGYATQTAPSGEHALQLWDRDGPFDLLITDSSMPDEIQGADLARELKGHTPHLPIILMSGYSTPGHNTDDFIDTKLMKPARQREILETIESLLSHS